MDGIVNVNKPKGITSYDVVRFFKRTFHLKEKIGHAGTLDPIAEGVLLVCLGRATGLSNRLMQEEKEYQAQLQLGTRTDTLDIAGKVLETREVNVSPEEVRRVVAGFRGEIEQIPPSVSALKHQGQPLYKLFRKGTVITPPARKVFVREIEILSIEIPRVDFRVVCSKGTYVRALCRDIGESLGCGGVQVSLTRTRIGPFTLAQAHTLNEIEQSGLARVIIPLSGKNLLRP